MPWNVFREGNQYCVHKTDSDGRKGEKVKCHDSMAAAEEQVKALYANVQEMVRETINDTLITEFRGNFPLNIPVRPGVDLEKLTEGDEQPFFLTVEISSEGRTSDNGLIHDRDFGETVARQIMSEAAEGIMGHIKEEDRITSYPVSDIHWIGAVKEGSKTWAKGYIPRTAAAQREHYRILMATNGKAATSVYGQALREFVDEKKGTWRAKDFKLEQLDLAPYSRAALKPESRFVITAEMANEPAEIETEQEEQITMTDKVKVIREMTPEDADLLPKPVREAILATVPAPEPAPEIALVTELRQALGTDEAANLVQLVTQMKQQEEQRAREAISGRIRELVEDGEKGIKVKAVRPLVTELVTVRNPQSVEQAEQFYEEVTGSEHIKELLQAHVVETMGPPQRTPVQSQNGEAKYFNVPEKETS